MTGSTRPWSLLEGSAALAALSVTLAPSIAAADPSYWAMQAWAQAQQVPVSLTFVPQPTPDVIHGYDALPDGTGLIGLYQPGGRTVTADNAFFASLGTNGRTCFSCHQPQDGWALKPETVRAAFLASDGLDPLFAAVDGSDCPDLVDDQQDNQCRQGSERAERGARFAGARRQLFTKANFRIFLPVPPKSTTTPEWTLRVVSDPYGCEENATYGLPNGFVSVYRRPLPSANVSALDPEGVQPVGIFPEGFNIMWDAREPDLASQFTDATLIHAQALPGTETTLGGAIAQGVAFQSGLFTAQAYDYAARELDRGGANGGPRFLSTLAPGIASVLNSPPEAFTVFKPWASPSGGAAATTAARASISHGEAIFNGTAVLEATGRTGFDIVDVTGLNDVVGQNPQPGSCGFCHNNQERGNDFFLDPKRLGIEDNSCAAPNTCGGATPGSRRALPPQPDMPLFSFLCPVGSIPFFSNPVWVHHHPYDELITTDPGLGLITGQCADLGRMKVPILRGLAARAPYFHGGNAATLYDVVDFYDQRFDIQLTAGEKHDLVSFLSSL